MINFILIRHYFNEAFTKPVANDKIDIQLKTNDIEYWAKHLTDKWRVRGPVNRPWNSCYLYLRDPDDLQIIIYQENKQI